MTQRDAMGLAAKDSDGQVQKIVLETEPDHHIAGFILGNSLCLTCREPPKPLGCECEQPNHLPVITGENSRRGEDVMICGAGPSLHDVGYHLKGHDGEVWGANSALNFLVEQGYPVTHGIAIDPSTRMFGEVWIEPPDVDYLIATTVNPGLTAHLIKHGRRITLFHSWRGAEEETHLYGVLYPHTCLAGHGLNVVNRALDLADWLGFSKIKLVGVDSAISVDGALYHDGREMKEDDWPLEGRIGKRVWRTKADMLMSAVELVRIRNRIGRHRVRFLGDTLPRALQDRSESFMRRCIDWVPTVAGPLTPPSG